jgi:hypothetical protein
MVRRWDLVEMEEDGVSSLCVGSMRDVVSMRDCIVASLGDVLGGFIYAAN